MRVLFVGDVHANRVFIKSVYQKAKDEEVDKIVQVGDFGWWPRTVPGQRFIYLASSLASQSNIPLLFVDGNHEDHDQLPHDATEVVELEPGIHYLPRGVVTTLGDSRVLGIGGAVSVDRQWRTEHVDWFREETANFAAYNKAATAEGSIDIVLAHDLPAGVDLELDYPVTPNVAAHCNLHRIGMRELMDIHKPDLWVGGHYHQRTTQKINGTIIEGLAHDAWGVETATLLMDLPAEEPQ